VLNSVAAGRRQAGRAIAWQVVATLLVALACLWQGPRWSVAALVGGGAVVLAGWFSARIALGGGVAAAVPALARLVAGVLAKWLVLVAALVLGVLAWGLPPLPMLAAAVVVLAAQVLALALAR
jgi:F0F1-type ATP synthase assembly protein I